MKHISIVKLIIALMSLNLKMLNWELFSNPVDQVSVQNHCSAEVHFTVVNVSLLSFPVEFSVLVSPLIQLKCPKPIFSILLHKSQH